LIILALIYHGCQQKEDFSYRCNRTTRWCASRLLLQKKHEVYALIRSTKSESPKAQNLRNQGAKLVEADLDKPDSLVQATNGIDSVFLMGTWVEVGTIHNPHAHIFIQSFKKHENTMPAITRKIIQDTINTCIVKSARLLEP